jgi:hypothetical protein
MEQQSSNNVYAVKISGPSAGFINKIAATIKDKYTVIMASRLKKNERDPGYHLFLTLVDMERV